MSRSMSTSTLREIMSRTRSPNLCQSCRRSKPVVRPAEPNFRHYTTSPPPPSPDSSSRRSSLRFIPLSFLVLPPILWYLTQDGSSTTLNPVTYTDHPVSSTRKISEQHKEITIPLSPASLQSFGGNSTTLTPPRLGEGDKREKGGIITVHHIMVKSPDLMIERPYTPVNDVQGEGEVKLVVKRVRGGEVGRLVHSLKPGDPVGLRGPIPTFSLDPSAYDRIVMVSSGTGIAPFLQFLSLIPPSHMSSSTKFDLVHASPPPDRTDWINDSTHIPRLESKHGDKLAIHRYPANSLPIDELTDILKSKANERVMLLVCLPPAMMRPICGPLTITLQQGELTGHLRDLGLRFDQVLKLE